MARKSKKNKIDEEIKNLDVNATNDNKNIDNIIDEIEEDIAVSEVKQKKEYVVVLGAPSFYVIKLEDGSMRTIQGSNTYRRGDIVKL